MIHIYTGHGKGKTTAALGLAVRAAGAGRKVYIGQFLKKGCYNELKSLRKIKNIKVEQFGRGCFVKKNPDRIDAKLAQKGFQRIKGIIKKQIYDVVILDEINLALHLGLLELKDAIAIIKNTPKNKELILTGRNAHRKLIALADYVSDMRKVKHPFDRGINCRKGIEF